MPLLFTQRAYVINTIIEKEAGRFPGDFIFDFFHSLDACAVFEANLNSVDYNTYSNFLLEIILRDLPREPMSTGAGTSLRLPTAPPRWYSAAAPQRCEAFLRFKGKWPE